MQSPAGSQFSGSFETGLGEKLDAGPFAVTRTTRSTLRFHAPFLLGGIDAPLPPGDYEVVGDEELIEGASRLAYPRLAYHGVATFIQLPAVGVRTGKTQLVPVDRRDLDLALRRDRELVAPDDRTAIA